MSRQVSVAFLGPLKNPPLNPPEMGINVNDSDLQMKENEDVICVTETITRRTITCSEYLCEEGYDSDVDIGQFLDVVVDEGDIEKYTEEVTDLLMQFQGAMAPATVSTIEFDAPYVESE